MDISKLTFSNIAVAIVDIETLGLTPGSVVTEVGISIWHKGQEVAKKHWILDIYRMAGLFDIDPKVQEWWLEQLGVSKPDLEYGQVTTPYSAKKVNVPTVFLEKWANPEPVNCTLQDITDWCRAQPFYDTMLFLGNGVDFDKVNLEHVFKARRVQLPWNHHRQWIDLPTLVVIGQLLTGRDIKAVVKTKHGDPTHHALEDAQLEGKMLRPLLEILERKA